MEWKRIQMESSAGAPQSDGSTSLYLHKYEYTYNTNTDQKTKQKCGRVNNPAPYFPKTHSIEVIGVYSL